MKRIFLASLISAFTVFAAPSSVSSAQEVKTTAPEMGISKVKPESGPFVEYNGVFLVPYTHEIERTSIVFEMIPVPGGEVVIGSPADEEGRSDDEGPQYTVTLPPYWVAKTELTWGEYKTFMRMYDVFKRLSSDGVRTVNDENRADAITVPTPLYDPAHTYQFGEDKAQPAVTMTQYAAKQYTKWLSGITGVEYRLPTEAEWEHAARAGAKTAYSFGNDPQELGKFATFADNADGAAAKVGLKEPNAFGLHDMHGNVWEWTIDQYDASGFGDRGGKTLSWKDGTAWPTEQDSRCVKGGGWQDAADRLRAAARMGSADEDWKESDPNVPLSPWWFTTDPARMVGMRLVRSAEPLTPELKKLFWDIDNETTQEDVSFRLKEGRGAIGLPVPELIKEFQRRAR